MSEDTGILLIYPLDLSKVFETNDNFSTTGYKLSLNEFGRDQGLLDLKIPLIGFALGFPDIRDVEGGSFVTRHLIKDIEEMTLEELQVYIVEKNITIDLSKKWDKKSLLEEIIEIEGVSGEEEFDDELIDI
jgi:hypothetical protein